MSADSSSSTSAFVSTLIFNGIIGSIFLLSFLTLRPKHKRTYEPRTLTDIQTLSDEDKTEPVPAGYFKWLPYILLKPHSFILQHTGLDGYLYLRYLGIFGSLSLLFCFILFPILLPVNATNGYNLKGFEILSFSNVKNKNRFYAHVFLSWIIFGLIIFIIYKELYYYIILKHATLTSPLYDGLLSSRTVIITELDESLMTEGYFEKIYPKCQFINFAYNLKELNDLTDERTKNSNKLEKIINKVINKSVKLNSKKKFDNSKPENNLDTYIPFNKRPKHRIGKWFLPPMEKWFGRKKVTTIPYCSEKIVELNEKIHPLQDSWQQNERLTTIFIQFESQLDAQECYQSLSEVIGKKKFGKKFIGSSPNDINWKNLNLSTKKRYSKKILANTFLTLLIIFWSIPVIVVGCISNINFLTTKVPFLRFINNLPNVLMGLITGILPTVALAILMSLVAPIITKIGNLSGCVTFQETSIFVQKWYYAFQVIQVFIVVTLASSASSTVQAIIDDPSSAMTLLAENLPKASNFYIVYFLLLGLTTPAGNLLQIVKLILSKILCRFDSTPRSKWLRYNTLSEPNYGVLYPTLQILTVIQICYIMIAPIILVFSTLALITLYIANLYNLIYVNVQPKHDLRGINYPMAIFQVYVALYLAEVCLLGLFIMAKSWGPLVLECVMLVITALSNIYFKRIFLPLLNSVPISAIKNARGESDIVYPYKDEGLNEIKNLANEAKLENESDTTGGIIRKATERDLERANLLPSEEETETPEMEESKRKQSNFTGVSTLGTESTKYTKNTFVNEDEEFRKLHYSDIDPSILANPNAEENKDEPIDHDVLTHGDVGDIYRDREAMNDEPKSQPKNVLRDNAIVRRIILFFKPWKSYPFAKMRQRLPHVFNTTIEYDKEYLENAYTNSSVIEKDPIIWVAKDPMGVSDELIGEGKTIGVDIRNESTTFDEKNKSMYTDNPPDYVPEAKI